MSHEKLPLKRPIESKAGLFDKTTDPNLPIQHPKPCLSDLLTIASRGCTVFADTYLLSTSSYNDGFVLERKEGSAFLVSMLVVGFRGIDGCGLGLVLPGG